MLENYQNKVTVGRHKVVCIRPDGRTETKVARGGERDAIRLECFSQWGAGSLSRTGPSNWIYRAGN